MAEQEQEPAALAEAETETVELPAHNLEEQPPVEADGDENLSPDADDRELV